MITEPAEPVSVFAVPNPLPSRWKAVSRVLKRWGKDLLFFIAVFGGFPGLCVWGALADEDLRNNDDRLLMGATGIGLGLFATLLTVASYKVEPIGAGPFVIAFGSWALSLVVGLVAAVTVNARRAFSQQVEEEYRKLLEEAKPVPVPTAKKTTRRKSG